MGSIFFRGAGAIRTREFMGGFWESKVFWAKGHRKVGLVCRIRIEGSGIRGNGLGTDRNDGANKSFQPHWSYPSEPWSLTLTPINATSCLTAALSQPIILPAGVDRPHPNSWHGTVERPRRQPH